MSEPSGGLTLASRLFLATALVVVVALGAAVAVTSVLGERVAAREARERIAASASLQTVSQQQRLQQLALLAEIMASKPDFKAYLFEAIRTRDRLSILDQLDERRSELGYDLAVVVDAAGILAARTDQPEVAGVDLSSRPLFAKVAEEFEAAGVWSERGRLYEAVAVPMALDEGIFGFLAIGYAITDVRALDVKRGAGSETIFVADPAAGAVASSLTPQETQRVLSALTAGGASLGAVASGASGPVQRELVLGGERWLAQLRPLHDAGETAVGAAVSLVSLDRELEGYVQVRQTLIAVGVAALLVALGVSWLIARRVGKPIQDLARATEAAREGRYDVTIPSGGSGEVLALANRFNALLAELRERREMADYVEKLARNLPEAGAARAAVAELPAESREATVVAVELRRHLKLRPGQGAAGLLDRLSADLARVAAAVAAHGGTLEAVHGNRAIAAFTGAARGERALSAAAEIVVAAGGDSAGDAGVRPAAALADGELVRGVVRWGESGGSALLGLPLREVESLVREAGEGEILITAGVHTQLAGALAAAGIDLRPHRALLTTQPIYLVDAERAAQLAVAGGQRVTQLTAPVAPAADVAGDRSSLAAIGPGSLLGSRFEILAVLGAGGMGVVYKARDRELDDLVALKMLRRDVGDDEALLGRLKTELKLARRITHPNVLRTYDFGEIDGHAFISMEYVRGITMRSMIEQSGRLPYSAAMWLARQLLAGLAAAHELEILHRDIKPENVLLDSAGNLKLMDFGLARPVKRMERGQTQAGWIVGTPHYLAPEQIEGRDPDRRADVYACGVVLYELFTDQLPFDGGNPMDVLMHHLKTEPRPPRELAPEMPPALDALVLRCLAKDPARRPRDAGTLLDELEQI
jgi:serine/threonine-protein kinase